MVEQTSNNQNENSYVNNSIEYGLKFYDIVLLLIPMLFIIGFIVTIITSIRLQTSLSISATISALFIVYCLFIDSLKIVN